MNVAIGAIDHFELAGHVFDRLKAIFPLEAGGAFSDRHTIGNIGQECMMPFRAGFDYRSGRAAFIERSRR